MNDEINQPTPNIAECHTRWKRNRDIIAGEDAVKAAREAYLPRLGNQSEAEYSKYLARVPFFPGASRTRDGMLGLMTRKAGEFVCPTALEDIFSTITRSGHDVDDLAEEVSSDALVTGFYGLLVDHPAPTTALTILEAEANGFRPFVAPYAAESILEVTPGVVGNRQVVTRVRLLDDVETVRDLRLEDGVYTVTMHHLVNGNWIADETSVPLRQGSPLTFIPFVIVSAKPKAFGPVKGPLDDICLLNVHLFREEADAKNSRYYSSAPILTILGAEEEDLAITPGTVLFFPGHSVTHPVDVKFTEFSGAGQQTLENAVASREDEMAKVGSNILASEKSAVEAAETHAIRRSSENSVLASLTRSIGRKIEEALDIAAWWAGQERGSVTFTLNSDFVPTPMTAEERKACLAELMSGAISHETFFAMYVAGEVLPESFDAEAELQRIAADSASIDRPSNNDEEAPDQPVT